LYEDRDWLVRAIREAPLAYDKDSWTKQASLFYLVGEIVKHGDRLSRAVEGAEQRESGEWTIVAGEHSPSQALADLRAIELKEWFTTAFATLLDRSDGHRVAIAFGAELVGRTASDRGLGRPKKSWDAEDAARDVLIEQIAKAGISGAEMRAAAPIPTASSARRSPLHHLVLSACVDHLRRASTDRCIAATVPDPAAVWSWYGELLHKQDSTLSSHVNPYGPAQPWIFAALGSALLAQPDPAARWLEEWKSLYSQRELARFSPDRYDSLAPSEHLLLVARNASLVKAPGQTKEEDRRLWWAAETELTSLFLSGLLLRTPLEAIGPWNFFVVVPHVMGESWAECVRGSKELFQANDVVTLLSASSLVYNGRDARSVSHVFGEIGCDPVVVGTRLLRWMTDSGEEQKSRIDIPAILSLFQTQTKESKL
jgi:hypothetical protein